MVGPLYAISMPSVRECNGLMVLRELLYIKQPLSEADALRCLACVALEGLTRCEQIRQIVSKMTLIVDNGLQC